LEAQTVLELLKAEEVREFTGVVRSGSAPTTVPEANDEIQAIQELITLGEQIYACDQTSACDEGEEGYRLYEELLQVTSDFNTEIQELLDYFLANERLDELFQNPENLGGKAADIVEARPGTILVYPFVTQSELWLMWATAGGVADAERVPISSDELVTEATKLRNMLTRSGSTVEDVKAQSAYLYDQIIAPLEEQLRIVRQQAMDKGYETAHLVFALDRMLRYLPMAALYNSEEEQYLVEDYMISTVTSAEQTEMDDRIAQIKDEINVLALGVSESFDEFPYLSPLENVPIELFSIVERDQATLSEVETNFDDIELGLDGVFPGQVFLNDRFSRDTLIRSRNHNIVHIATHAQFARRFEDDSFLLAGDGSQISTLYINDMGRALRDVHLVVLSACETALGGMIGGDSEENREGIEIPGISSHFIQSGDSDDRASAVLASLWLVSDRSTSMLMQRFYNNLSTQALPTKAEALRQAQLEFIQSSETSLSDDERRMFGVGPRDGTSPSPTGISSYAHPYHWAPFILIGNGL